MKTTTIILSIFIIINEASSQIASWDFEGGNGGYGSTGVIAGSALIGSGIEPSTGLCTGSGTFAGDNFYDALDASPTTESEAVSDFEYIEFPISAQSGYTVTISSVSFTSRKTSTGPGFRAVYENNFNIGSSSQTTNSACQAFSIDISDITINGGETKVFRIYAWGATDAAGTLRLDDIVFEGNALPVELVLFKAKVVNTTFELNWQTASELNNSHFSIERSTDGLNFREIGIVQGNGTTTEPQHYEFVDEYPAKGTNYYRLKQMDFDGKFEYSKVVSVSFGTSSHAVLYPTLASSVVNLKFTEPIAEDGNITLFDINGRLVGRHAVEPETEQMEISVENLQPGHYFAKIQIGRLLENFRFVKQ